MDIVFLVLFGIALAIALRMAVGVKTLTTRSWRLHLLAVTALVGVMLPMAFRIMDLRK